MGKARHTMPTKGANMGASSDSDMVAMRDAGRRSWGEDGWRITRQQLVDVKPQRRAFGVAAAKE
jgi:hypothetical protein